MSGNGHLSPAVPPRALVLATGEDVPAGHSIRARQLIVEVKAGDVNRKVLGECQRSGCEGELSGAVAAFIRWIAGQYKELQESLHARARQLRNKYDDQTAHARLPSALAQLQAGWEIFLRFALEIGAIDRTSNEQLERRGLQAFRELGTAQVAFRQSGNPALRFLSLVRSALTSGHAHVANRQGGAPDDPARWGWLSEASGKRTKSLGIRIGWVSGPDLFLDPVMSYQVAQQMAGARGFILSAPNLCGTNCRNMDCWSARTVAARCLPCVARLKIACGRCSI